jgi:hypothetical protein
LRDPEAHFYSAAALPLRPPEVFVLTSKVKAMVGAALVSCSILGVGQDAAQSPKHPTPDSPRTQLVAWSELQKPKPIPAEGQAPAAQLFSGVIRSQRGQYILLVENRLPYALDDQQSIRPYEALQVRIAGSIDSATGTLHIVSIQAVH